MDVSLQAPVDVAPVFGKPIVEVILRQNWKIKAALGVLLFLIILAIWGVHFLPYDPIEPGNLITERFLSPSLQHPFGTDKFGRDVLVRVLYGTRISLTIASIVVFLTLTVGTLYGTISAYFGGKVDEIMMRILDFWLAFPAIFLIITVVALFKPSRGLLIVLLVSTSWMEVARYVRAEVLHTKELEYVAAAKIQRFSHWRIIFDHILHN